MMFFTLVFSGIRYYWKKHFLARISIKKFFLQRKNSVKFESYFASVLKLNGNIYEFFVKFTYTSHCTLLRRKYPILAKNLVTTYFLRKEKIEKIHFKESFLVSKLGIKKYLLRMTPSKHSIKIYFHNTGF